MLWFHQSRKFFDLLEGMDLAEMILDHPFRFLSLLRTSEMLVKPI